MSRTKVADAALVVIGVVVFAWLFGFRWGVWYSGDWPFREQTEALLHGHLRLGTVPQALRYDYAWGNGAQQVWGLGIPLWRLPFEVVAKGLGAVGFPDVIAFILLFALVAVVFVRAVRDSAPWERAALLAAALFCPAFIMMCRTRFQSYEEAAGGGFLMEIAVGALLLLLAEKPTPRRLYAVMALSGAGMHFRPTVIFYGCAAFSIALFLAYRARLPRRVLAIACVIFALGPATQLASNHARFGHAFEWGHRLNVSYNKLDQFAKNFGHPYEYEPPLRAARELVSALFLAETPNGYDFYRPNVMPLQSGTIRFRELYFSTFRPWMGLLVLLSWIGALAALYRRWDTRIAVAAAYSFLAFVPLALFYLRVVSITSRYMTDFAASFVFAWMAFLLIAFHHLRARPIFSAALAALTVLAVGWTIAHGWVGEVQSHRKLLTAEEVRFQLQEAREVAPPLPSGWKCEHGLERVSGIKLNGVGWSKPHCQVQVLTQLFLPSADCLSLRVGPADEPTLTADSVRPIRVRRGLTMMTRIRDVPVGDARLLTFCAPASAPRNPTGIEVYFLAWTAREKLWGPHFRLDEVRTEARGF